MSDEDIGASPPRGVGEVLLSIESICSAIVRKQEIAEQENDRSEIEKALASVEQLCATVVNVTCNPPEQGPVELATKSKLIEFKDLTKVAAGATVDSTIHGEPFGCRNFVCYARCDRDAIIKFELGESPMEWYPLEDREHSDVKPEHANGTVGTSAVTITPAAQLQSAMIHNTHLANQLYASFDDGDSWTTIEPEQSLSMPCDAYSYQLKGSAAGTTYESVHVYYLWGWRIKGGAKKVFEFRAPAAKFIRTVVENLSTSDVLNAEISIKAID